MGRRPYHGANRKEIRADILSHQESVKIAPKNWTSAGIDFANKLLLRKPGVRLGKGGIDELINHEWFSDFDWNSLKAGHIKSPIKPMSLD